MSNQLARETLRLGTINYIESAQRDLKRIKSHKKLTLNDAYRLGQMSIETQVIEDEWIPFIKGE